MNTSDSSGQPMRLLVLASTFPLTREEAGPRFVYDLADSLTEHVGVTVLAPDAPGAELEEDWGKLHIRRFTYFRPRHLQRLAYGGGMRSNLSDSLLAKLQIVPFLITQVLAVRKMIRSGRFSVINSHWIVPQGLVAAIVRSSGVEFGHVLQVHAGDVYMLKRMPFGRVIARYVVSKTDVVLAAGSHVRDVLDELLGYPSGATLQPMGVRSALFQTPARSPETSAIPGEYILFIGRFVEKKGVVYLIRAVELVRNEFPDIHLILVGYGPLEEKLKSETEKLGLTGAVRFEGRQSHEAIVSYLEKCRVAVVPSIVDSRGETEGMPTVVTEAMAAGIRVVGSRVDGIPDLIRHGENGWLCEPKDPEDLADKLIEALREPDPSRVAVEARLTAAELDWERVALRYSAYVLDAAETHWKSLG